MTSTAKLLLASADLPNAPALLYTSPAGGKGTWIDKATAMNHSGAAATIQLNHVPNGGSALAANIVVNTKSIADKATDLLPEIVGKFIPPGAAIYGLCSAATAVAFELNGRELT